MNDEPWISFFIQVPTDKSSTIHSFLEYIGFRDTDWCELTRRSDGSRASWGPCPNPNILEEDEETPVSGDEDEKKTEDT